MYVLLSPFSCFGSREWPEERFAELAVRLHTVGIGAHALGASDHKDCLERVFGRTHASWHYGQPPEFVAKMIRESACVVANDSGMAHYAGFLGVKAIAIHSGSLPHEYLFGESPTIRSVTAGRTLPRSDHDTAALRAVTVEQVFAAVCEMIGVDLRIIEARQRSLLGDKLDVLLEAIRSCPPGDVAELGVYRGGASALMALTCPDRTVWAFDTFEGMPLAGENDVHQVGEFADTTGTFDYLRQFSNVRPVQGVFPASAKGDAFAFVHLDADQYQSTLDGLKYFWPRIVPGGAMVLDDWEWHKCPGVKRAVLEHFGGMPANARAVGNQLIVRRDA